MSKTQSRNKSNGQFVKTPAPTEAPKRARRKPAATTPGAAVVPATEICVSGAQVVSRPNLRRQARPVESDFERELTALLNKHAKDIAAGTPDFLLAAYLVDCLNTYAETVDAREGYRARILAQDAKTTPPATKTPAKRAAKPKAV